MSKLYRGECKSYTIDELAEDAKQYAYHKWYQTAAEYHGTDEIKATLNEFCRLFDVRCYSWEFDAYSHNFRFDILNDTLTCVENISGIRLATYIWNNYAQYITKGKYFSLWSKTERSEHNPAIRKLKSRHSRVMLSMEDCPLTGGCYDCNVLEPVIKCLSYQKLYNSYTELIEDCLDGLFLAAQKECEYVYSMEYFIDEPEIMSTNIAQMGVLFVCQMDLWKLLKKKKLPLRKKNLYTCRGVIKMFDLDWILQHEESYRYQMLDRLRCDCEFYLGYGYRNAKYLWANNEEEQIEYMKAIWNSFPETGKPEWLTYEQILDYREKMIGTKTPQAIIERLTDGEKVALIRKVCTQYKWFTSGNNFDYMQLYNYLFSSNLEAVYESIYIHSNNIQYKPSIIAIISEELAKYAEERNDKFV